jgi:hypothetical protein
MKQNKNKKKKKEKSEILQKHKHFTALTGYMQHPLVLQLADKLEGLKVMRVK